MSETPGLEDRVAALEAAVAFPMRIVEAPPMSGEEAARFRGEFEQSLSQPIRIMPQMPPLSPEQIRSLLSECVTVVKPGETLIVRVPVTWGPEQVGDYQRAFTGLAEQLKLPFRPIVVIGDELAVIQPEPDFMSEVKEEPLHGHDPHTIRLTHEPTSITIAARDRAEGVVKLRKALAGAARRQYYLQWKARVAEAREAGENTPVQRGADCPEHGGPLLWLGNGDLMCQQGHFYRIPEPYQPAAPSRRRARRS